MWQMLVFVRTFEVRPRAMSFFSVLFLQSPDHNHTNDRPKPLGPYSLDYAMPDAGISMQARPLLLLPCSA